MVQLRELVALYNIEIIIGLIAALFTLVLLYLIAEIRISRVKDKYDELVRGVKGVNIEELLIKTNEELKDIRLDMNTIDQKIESIETKLAFAIQKVGFVRYNAFGDMGSDLSFSIALLDKFQNGFVLTSIYGREHTTSYAKPIKFGKSIYPLSVEEIQAIDRAIIGEYKEKII
ncbi:DUF4446 family protein [Tissierella praeacuta]|uniref:DUF4446 domain-containing protein n=1 Tax=Tissierella praeacuta DSM 18095 TaxID=1123404 RepID=A0A1M4YYX3_9FIRM|nr:DUF4446 family protein [Tissierella praeacuta]HAE92758.1 DUF4446 domain-containing protein [Tissierella sp.]MBU5257138.1 DUF4446 family protein [Tissierella praeacuta]TCU66230.1 uncharacterized protein DUF4446 [Tissierella praeacuta]SHF10898.1 Protein of unknown function [Tissierella praeacuta DSM 18095]SUP04918.1 Uncharacterised protein [Tissierella praeacuta]